MCALLQPNSYLGQNKNRDSQKEVRMLISNIHFSGSGQNPREKKKYEAMLLFKAKTVTIQNDDDVE